MHPLFLLRLKLQTRLGLRRRGLGFSDINHRMAGVEDWEETVSYAGAKAGVQIPDFTAEAGDGTLFEKIVAAIEKFLASDLGKTLVQALIALLIGA